MHYSRENPGANVPKRLISGIGLFVQICSKFEWFVSWIHLSAKFRGNLFPSFCVIRLTNQQTNREGWKHKVLVGGNNMNKISKKACWWPPVCKRVWLCSDGDNPLFSILSLNIHVSFTLLWATDVYILQMLQSLFCINNVCKKNTIWKETLNKTLFILWY